MFYASKNLFKSGNNLGGVQCYSCLNACLKMLSLCKMGAMRVIILAAGYSTRLKPLTDHIANPLLLIGSATILDSILEKILQIKGLDNILIVVNAKFYSQFEAWRWNIQVTMKTF